jgi:hypothetical protein
VVRKTSGKQRRGRKSKRPEMCTSTQEITVAKPLGRGKKLSTKSSGLSVAEKASLVGVVTVREN